VASQVTTTIIKRVEEIPEKYNDHPQILLKDFQEGLVTQSEVLQILILYQNRGTFSAVDSIDVEHDYFYVDKNRREEVDEIKRQLQSRGK